MVWGEGGGGRRRGRGSRVLRAPVMVLVIARSPSLLDDLVGYSDGVRGRRRYVPACPLVACASHFCSQRSASRTVVPLGSRPLSASQSATSFPGMLVWDRTCVSTVSLGRSEFSARHSRRAVWMISSLVVSLFLYAFGIHLPVVMLIAYRESEHISSCPAPYPRALACCMALMRALSSPVLLVALRAPTH